VTIPMPKKEAPMLLDADSAAKRINALPCVKQAGWVTGYDAVILALEVQAETLEYAVTHYAGNSGWRKAAQMTAAGTRAEIDKLERANKLPRMPK
jgi:hypothetical protein